MSDDVLAAAREFASFHEPVLIGQDVLRGLLALADAANPPVVGDLDALREALAMALHEEFWDPQVVHAETVEGDSDPDAMVCHDLEAASVERILARLRAHSPVPETPE